MIWISLKVALRHLLREKYFTVINLLGLGIALAASLFILQFVVTEYSYDLKVPHHSGKYRLILNIDDKGDVVTYATNYLPVGEEITRSIPEIVSFNRFYYLDRHAIINIGEQKFNQMDVLFADLNFFEFFGYPTDQYRGNSALKDGAFLSSQLALKYFGNNDPIGQILKVNTEDGEYLFEVAGIFSPSDGLSHLDPQMILPVSRLESNPFYQRYLWIWNFFGTYIEIDDKADPEVVQGKINQLIKKLVPDRGKGREYSVRLQPVTDIHLEPGLTYEYADLGNGLITRYLLFSVVFIVALAFLNYINITSARNSLRIKEMGVRKILGSHKYHIRLQLLLEAFLLNLGAVVLCLTLIQLMIPVLNMFGIGLRFDLFGDPFFWSGLFLVLFIGSIFTGFVPSLVLSAINAREAILKGLRSKRSGLRLRHILVAMQFSITLIMIASVLIMQSQLKFMINKDKGVKLDEVVVIHGPRASLSSMEAGNFKEFLNEMNRVPGVESPSVSTSVPGIWMGNGSLKKFDSEDVPTQAYRSNSEYFTCYGLELIAGRFYNDAPADIETIMINQLASEKLGFTYYEQAIDQRVMMGRTEKKIIGVVSDYHHFNLREPVYPTMFLPFTDNSSAEYFSFKLTNPEDPENTLAGIESIWDQFFPQDPMDYYYQNKLFEREHSFEAAIVQTFSLFTILAMLIACLGLVGLATFISNSRVKEIGIRKVLGASVPTLIFLLVKSFLILVAIGVVLGTPLIYTAMSGWLDNYAYRIEFPWWVIPFSGLTLLVVTLLTVGYQTAKTALSNPVESLRYE